MRITQQLTDDILTRNQGAITSADGNYDIFEQLGLSGEPMIPQLIPDFPYGKPGPVMNAIEVEERVLELKKYRVKYRNYWLSTAHNTSTGKLNSGYKLGLMTCLFDLRIRPSCRCRYSSRRCFGSRNTGKAIPLR